MAIEIRTEGRRHYLRGDTYPLKDALRAAGCKWDADAKAWWTGKRETAEQLAAQLGASSSAAPSVETAERPQAQAPGLDATVAGRAQYKGKTYYVAGRVARGRTHWDDELRAVESRDGSRLLLYFRDGSSQFWAAADAVQILKSYRRPTTIQGLRDYADQRKAEDRGEAECPTCERHCTCGTDRFCSHHHDGCDRCGAEG